ncbi:FkbM family methyltransferase [Desulfurivibrio dismutans]|uniref:FkbM family methyltransferase n=1 Tax=Desulfurivibrio dismutans TaxID=1398908 RepID=UPI0023D9AEF0|nr:FkbM family methyltransferase [Desulfurivibrio alkaliphilus]MDF1615659.1 FkbM family methyltransferase [Desulfurivibrio alkaliphilus]
MNRMRQKTTGHGPAVIIHLGAGQGHELDNYLSLRPEKIVLVEAEPSAVRALERRTASLAQVEVLPVAVAATSGKAVLKGFNLPRFNSLRTPSGITELFPGLRLHKDFEVNALTTPDLINKIGPTAEQENWLVIDVPGEEAEVLEALQQAGRLHLFDRIVLHCGKVALYEGGRDAELLLRLLDDNGFEVVSCEAEMDPDRPCWVLQKNLLKIENRELRSQLEQLKQAKAEQAKLAAERQAKLNELIKSRDEQSHHVSELKTQLDQATQAKAEQAKLASERQNRIKQLESTLAEFESRQGLLAEEMARAEGQIDLIKDVLLRDPGL